MHLEIQTALLFGRGSLFYLTEPKRSAIVTVGGPGCYPALCPEGLFLEKVTIVPAGRAQEIPETFQ
jgi:hypothetical protein